MGFKLIMYSKTIYPKNSEIANNLDQLNLLGNDFYESNVFTLQDLENSKYKISSLPKLKIFLNSITL